MLWHCFGLRSGSIYKDDLAENDILAKHVGHVEQNIHGTIPFHQGELRLVKTHEKPFDEQPSIYVVRDGRAACMSLWYFYDRAPALNDILSGRHRFGSWAGHLAAWEPWKRPNTLILRYETMLSDLPEVLAQVSTFLSVDIISGDIPDRDSMASYAGGRWVRRASNWRSEFGAREKEIFDAVNADMMYRMGYYT